MHFKTFRTFLFSWMMVFNTYSFEQTLSGNVMNAISTYSMDANSFVPKDELFLFDAGKSHGTNITVGTTCLKETSDQNAPFVLLGNIANQTCRLSSEGREGEDKLESYCSCIENKNRKISDKNIISFKDKFRRDLLVHRLAKSIVLYVEKADKNAFAMMTNKEFSNQQKKSNEMCLPGNLENILKQVHKRTKGCFKNKNFGSKNKLFEKVFAKVTSKLDNFKDLHGLKTKSPFKAVAAIDKLHVKKFKESYEVLVDKFSADFSKNQSVLEMVNSHDTLDKHKYSNGHKGKKQLNLYLMYHLAKSERDVAGGETFDQYQRRIAPYVDGMKKLYATNPILRGAMDDEGDKYAVATENSLSAHSTVDIGELLRPNQSMVNTQLYQAWAPKMSMIDIGKEVEDLNKAKLLQDISKKFLANIVKLSKHDKKNLTQEQFEKMVSEFELAEAKRNNSDCGALFNDIENMCTDENSKVFDRSFMDPDVISSTVDEMYLDDEQTFEKYKDTHILAGSVACKSWVNEHGSYAGKASNSKGNNKFRYGAKFVDANSIYDPNSDTSYEDDKSSDLFSKTDELADFAQSLSDSNNYNDSSTTTSNLFDSQPITVPTNYVASKPKSKSKSSDNSRSIASSGFRPASAAAPTANNPLSNADSKRIRELEEKLAKAEGNQLKDLEQSLKDAQTAMEDAKTVINSEKEKNNKLLAELEESKKTNSQSKAVVDSSFNNTNGIGSKAASNNLSSDVITSGDSLASGNLKERSSSLGDSTLSSKGSTDKSREQGIDRSNEALLALKLNTGKSLKLRNYSTVDISNQIKLNYSNGKNTSPFIINRDGKDFKVIVKKTSDGEPLVIDGIAQYELLAIENKEPPEDTKVAEDGVLQNRAPASVEQEKSKFEWDNALKLIEANL